MLLTTDTKHTSRVGFEQGNSTGVLDYYSRERKLAKCWPGTWEVTVPKVTGHLYEKSQNPNRPGTTELKPSGDRIKVVH